MDFVCERWNPTSPPVFNGGGERRQIVRFLFERPALIWAARHRLGLNATRKEFEGVFSRDPTPISRIR